ncbi:probable inactive tRNA-specific adenosine deaminase-like protein 3 [Ostrinia furnacalis]|uniref:probable inactive tRNA-specific adenosine deaminase-like protein 3 n=1 Tax=Ostrinia furnacalis TaxID=93504 RepID=UPI00103F80B2|nr:probable inactive tRNA-specific adenosine deaminase-like protein 3 [Ostrinia furnacalis]
MADEPATKKAKLEEIKMTENNIIEDYINKVISSRSNLKAVLSDDLCQNIETTKVYIASIKDKKMISKAIQVLNEKLPLNELNHLKRVRKTSILLCQSSNVTTNIQEFIDQNIPELKDVFESINEIDVPSQAPKLKKQYTEVIKIWSCNFHPENYLEKLASDNFFPQDELKSHRTYMAIAFETVRWYLKATEKGSTEELLSTLNASVVVDPSINSVVAVAFDNRLKHPVQHSAMLAIDNVAKTQYGGAWDSKTNDNLPLSGIDGDLLKHLRVKYPDVKFGAKKFVSKEENIENGDDGNTGPYLCTNYHVYLLREPCVMCSMGLTHARVKRVFFCFDNAEFGALKSKAKLHTVQSLNHRYEVFTGFL